MQKSACGVDHEYDPDSRFCCKVRYWRIERPPPGVDQRLKAANRDHYTQREISNEIFAHARETGTEIQRVR